MRHVLVLALASGAFALAGVAFCVIALLAAARQARTGRAFPGEPAGSNPSMITGDWGVAGAAFFSYVVLS